MLLNTIHHSFRVTRLLFRVTGFVNAQKKYLAQQVAPLIDEVRRYQDGSLDEADIKKLTGYYGLAVPAILGEAFCVLRGKGMTMQERLCSTAQGAMTGLGDDFFDKQRLSAEGVKAFVETPGQFSGNTASEKLFLHFYKMALANGPSAAAMQQQLLKVFQAQLLSRQQKEPGLSAEVIQDITLRKGAESLLYYRTAFSHPLAAGEEKLLYALGGLMQLSNDIFDVYPDGQENISTPVTTATHIDSLRTRFLSLWKLCYQAAYRTKYRRSDIKAFMDILSIGIFSRCLVCLDQLQENEKQSGGTFTPQAYTRKQLVCDMDTAGNKWRSVKYHWGIEKRLLRKR